jgi:hypothetical protein
MALIRRHWKLALFNALVIVSSIVALMVYFAHSGQPLARAATAGQSGGSGTGSAVPIALDATGYTRVFQLRNAVCLTPIDLAAMGCSQSQAATILSSLGSWYRSNSSAWDSISQQISSANQQLTQQATQRVTGAGSPALWQQMSAANAEIDDANTNLGQLMQAAATAITPLLNAQQQTLWTTVQSNVANNVPPDFRYAPNVTLAQAQMLMSAEAKHQANIASLLSSQQQTALQTILQAETQNANALFTTDFAVLPIPSALLTSTSTQAPTTVPSGSQ